MAYKILVVDDSKAMRLMIQRSLRNAGLDISEALEAGDGIEGQKVLSTTKDVDIIFSDWNMPNMTGIECLKWTREQADFINTPFFMITTEGGEEQIGQAQEAGDHGYLTKPFTAEDIEETLDDFISA